MTPAEIFTAAYGRNRKNQPGILASTPELFNAFLRLYPVFWQIAARVNPAFLGSSDAVSYSAGGWTRPADAESIFRIELDGERVVVVALDERDAEPGEPCVYEWGQRFFPAGASDADPGAGDDLTFWFSKKPTLPEDEDEELESLWPSDFNELLILEMALYLAHKDEREEEVAILRADRDVWLRRFVAHLEHATLGVSRSTGQAQRYQGPSYVPLTEMLTGGQAT